ncbi:MAG: arylesterase [Alcanivorax sp.]|nr:arylesterase [Alcanivorax sp.]
MRYMLGLLCGMLSLMAPADVLIVGDSISAAYGIDKEQGWVSLLEQRVSDECPGMAVNNASVSGETTAGGLARLPALLQRHSPAIVVIELGGNDGLRGMPPAQMARNLRGMISAVREAGAEPLLFGMLIPPNYGAAYNDMFERAFRDVAASEDVAFLPFFLEGIGGEDGLMQEDGIHPTAAAQPILLDNAWSLLAPAVSDKCEGGDV